MIKFVTILWKDKGQTILGENEVPYTVEFVPGFVRLGFPNGRAVYHNTDLISQIVVESSEA
jgi:hypothetical protein